MSKNTDNGCSSKKKDRVAKPISRRTVFKMGLATGIAMPMSALGQSPSRLRPQPGDQLVFEEGPNQDALVRPELLELEARPLSALARDPATELLRDGSRLNRMMIMRIDPELMSARYQANVAEGVIARVRSRRRDRLRCN